MARYMVEHNYVQVIGKIWMPSTTAAMEYTLSPHDVDEINDYADIRSNQHWESPYVEEGITREDVAQWLTTHSGDFQSVTDFHASIGDLDLDWEDVENAFVYHDCMYGDGED